MLITEWFAHTPRAVLAKNFGVPEASFANIPKTQKYIFPLPVPAPLADVLKQLPEKRPVSPFTWHASAQEPQRFDGDRQRSSTCVTFHGRRFPL